MTATTDDRALAARAFALKSLNLAEASFAPASADASFRRYFRLESNGQSWVVMDAPPEREDCRPFVAVTGLMQQAGLNVPQIVAQDLQQGFLLLSDLGRQTFLQAMTPATADQYFADAIKALIALQHSSKPGVLQPYDAALLQRELNLFPDWYVARHLNHVLDTEQTGWWEQTCEVLIASALAQPRVFVHRDYMPRNLMVSVPSPGVLDYQDAVYGPITYDVVSLFRDAFLSWPAEQLERWRQLYWQSAQEAGLPVNARYADFCKAFDLMGLQRHLKVLGIFARINYRDGKPQYLADTPRFIRYVWQVAPLYPELDGLLKLFVSLGMRD